ncbi:NUDIX domain-containing protein [Nocardioides jishulii]|uniref:NUDIX hydrolase n=1 Tax=Nocardioides jishulii TaxID=2575440 RepID=A0A4V5TJT7_9ACTN|nr:NUDIX hydrolase [Nocardioides jishulii]TKI60953.1 NUDIX hydrolase [Nocardioides jishulii]
MFTYCTEGHRHWGRLGAAGLLLADRGRVLLQLRSRGVHQGGTWSIPCGARERGETFDEAALREAREECGIDPTGLRPLNSHVSVCGGWPFVTFVAAPIRPLDLRANQETARVAWVPLDDVAGLDLHPGFARTWHDRLEELTR